jgi:simple sugar transport system ATP-binding protein
VAENIAFATQLAASTDGFFSRRRLRAISQARVLDRIGVDIPIDARVETLPVAHKQLVAIARALASRRGSSSWTNPPPR